MNRNIAEGKWKQMKGDIKTKWGRLTDDELDMLDGDVEKLAGLIQEHYGRAQEDAEREVREWRREYGY